MIYESDTTDNRFQFTHPERCDRRTATSTSSPFPFQFTHPERCDTWMDDGPLTVSLSIHAPREVRRMFAACPYPSASTFNSRTPRGATWCYSHTGLSWKSFNSRTPRGATKPRRKTTLAACHFQFTHPERCDKNSSSPSGSWNFQFTHPERCDTAERKATTAFALSIHAPREVRRYSPE